MATLVERERTEAVGITVAVREGTWLVITTGICSSIRSSGELNEQASPVHVR